VKETYHNRKREKSVVFVIPIKVLESVAEVNAQFIKPIRMPLRYPCIIYYNSKHRVPDCPKKAVVQNIL
jgi:hypothetical protein